MRDKKTLRWFDLLSDLLLKAYTSERFYKLDLVDWISSLRGWNPLVIGKDMVVSFGNKRYKIERLEDME